MHSRFVLVTGATGHQGGVVADRLLGAGHRVRALTRNAESEPARRLQRLGAEVVVGDFDDRASLDLALRGVDSLFAMSTPFAAGPAVEARQAKGLIDAAADSSLEHIVYASFAGADRPTGVPHFDSKREVEEYLTASSIPSTIVAPAFFMENLLSPMVAPEIRTGVFAMPLPPGRLLEQVALSDIGGFVALVLERRDPFIGRRIALASDALSPAEEAERLSRFLSRPIRYEEAPLERVRSVSDDLARMFEWLGRESRQADIEGLRRDYPEVGWHRFDAWLGEQDLSVLAPEQTGLAAEAMMPS
jgi:uncharacterized protein YbjT (DUF2867 family)